MKINGWAGTPVTRDTVCGEPGVGHDLTKGGIVADTKRGCWCRRS